MSTRRVTRQSRVKATESAPGGWSEEEREQGETTLGVAPRREENNEDQRIEVSQNEDVLEEQERVGVRNRSSVGLLSPSLMTALASANLENAESPAGLNPNVRQAAPRHSDNRQDEADQMESSEDEEIMLTMRNMDRPGEYEPRTESEGENPLYEQENEEEVDCSDLMELPLKDLYERRDDIEVRIVPRLAPPEAGRLMRRLEQAYDKYDQERVIAIRVEKRLAAAERAQANQTELRQRSETPKNTRAATGGRRYGPTDGEEPVRVTRLPATNQQRQARFGTRDVSEPDEGENAANANIPGAFANRAAAPGIRPCKLNAANIRKMNALKRDENPKTEVNEVRQTRKRCTQRAATPGARKLLTRSKIARTASLTDARGYITPDDAEYDSEEEDMALRRERWEASGMTENEIRKEREATRVKRLRKIRHQEAVNRYNPMRVTSPTGRKPGQTRRQARREEYDRLYGPPMYNNYPSSDTDLSEDYTTEQEPFEVVEARYAGDEGYGDCDWRTWPLHKMRRVHKNLKRSGPKMGKEIREEMRSLQHRKLEEPEQQYIRRLEDNLARKEQKIKQIERVQKMYQVQLGVGKARALAQEAILSDGNESQEEQPETTRRTTGNPKSKLTQVNVVKNRNNNAGTTAVPPLMLGNDPPTEQSTPKGDATSNPGTSRTTVAGYMGDGSRGHLEIPIFTGQNWPTFRNQFERVAEQSNWTETERAGYMYNAIRGEAANALSSAESKNWGYHKLVAHMEMRHGRNKCYGDVVLELMAEYRKPGQTLAAWNDQVINIVNTGNLSKGQMDSTAFYGFVFGLRGNPGMYNKVLSTVSRQTIDEAFSIALKWEQDHGSRSFMSPAGFNMVAAAEDPDVQEQVRAKPETALATMVHKTDYKMTGGEIVQQLAGKIDSLGEHFEQRFDALTNRVDTLERFKPKAGEPYGNTRSSRGSFGNNYNSGGNRRGGANNSSWRRRDQGGRENFRQRDGSRGGYNTRSFDRDRAREDADDYRDSLRRDRSPRAGQAENGRKSENRQSSSGGKANGDAE